MEKKNKQRLIISGVIAIISVILIVILIISLTKKDEIIETPTSITITFVSNGGSEIAEITGISGTTINAPSSPTRAGYVFDAWYNDESFNVEFTFNIMPSENITIYAKWLPNNNTLIFNGNGAMGSMDNMTIATDASVDLPTNAFTKINCIFNGWATILDGEVVYLNSANYTMGTEEIYILYAIWEEVQQTSVSISFVTNGGSDLSPFIANAGESITQPADPTKEDNDFAGWYSDIERSVPFVFSIMPTENITLYADWGTNGLSYTLINSDSEYSVGKGTIGNINEVNIPKMMNNKPITLLDNYAFANCSHLVSINLPIGLTSISDNAFMNCTSLINISIPSNVTSFGHMSFFYCNSLASINIPSGVTEIKSSAFNLCNSLTSITIPNTVTHIGITAFKSTICEIIFEQNSSLTLISNNTFENYQGTNINLPNSITSIGEDAFKDAVNISNLIIPNSVTTLSAYAFRGTTANITFQEGSVISSIAINAFRDYKGTSVILPDSVLSIANSAFAFCVNLTNIVIPDSVIYIENYAFRNCTSLSAITLPTSLTVLNQGIFMYCSSLTTINIPSSVESIAGFAFFSCSSLTTIHIQRNAPGITTCIATSFGETDALVAIYVRSDSVIYYKDAVCWLNYKEKIYATP